MLCAESGVPLMRDNLNCLCSPSALRNILLLHRNPHRDSQCRHLCFPFPKLLLSLIILDGKFPMPLKQHLPSQQPCGVELDWNTETPTHWALWQSKYWNLMCGIFPHCCLQYGKSCSALLAFICPWIWEKRTRLKFTLAVKKEEGTQIIGFVWMTL